jgi:hypothetical protein
MLTSGQNKHPVRTVNGDPGTFQQLHAVGQMNPVVDKTILKISLTIDISHLDYLTYNNRRGDCRRKFPLLRLPRLS